MSNFISEYLGLSKAGNRGGDFLPSGKEVAKMGCEIVAYGAAVVITLGVIREVASIFSQPGESLVDQSTQINFGQPGDSISFETLPTTKLDNSANVIDSAYGYSNMNGRAPVQYCTYSNGGEYFSSDQSTSLQSVSNSN